LPGLDLTPMPEGRLTKTWEEIKPLFTPVLGEKPSTPSEAIAEVIPFVPQWAQGVLTFSGDIVMSFADLYGQSTQSISLEQFTEQRIQSQQESWFRGDYGDEAYTNYGTESEAKTLIASARESGGKTYYDPDPKYFETLEKMHEGTGLLGYSTREGVIYQ